MQVARLIPQLKQDISITVVDTADHLLGAFDREVRRAGQYARACSGAGVGVVGRGWALCVCWGRQAKLVGGWCGFPKVLNAHKGSANVFRPTH